MSGSFLDNKTRGPALVSDTSTVVDVAAISQKLSPVVKETGHVVNTTYIPIGVTEFKNLFYSVDGEHFQLNRTICNQPKVTQETKVLYEKTRFNNKFVAGPSIQRFNLIEHVIQKYEEDMGVTRECWEPCSVIDLEAVLGGLASICDVGDGCQVDCALKWSEIESILTQKRTSLCYGESELSADCAVREILVISVILKSSNPDVQNCTVKFRFSVDWCCDPCMNPWLTHYVDPNSAIGAVFFSTQQIPNKSDPSVIDSKLLPVCFDKDLINYDGSLNGYAQIDVSGANGEDLSGCVNEGAVLLYASNIYTHCEQPLYGKVVTDPLVNKQLLAGVEFNFHENLLRQNDLDTVQSPHFQTSRQAGSTQGVCWTTNPLGGSYNSLDPSGGGGVWPDSWPLANGQYKISDFAGGKNVSSWFWNDWTHYLISVKFPCEPGNYNLLFSPSTDVSGGVLPSNQQELMVPLSFKWLPWMPNNCTPISFKYWCNYTVTNDIPSPVDVYGERVLTSNNWLTINDGYVLPIFNDSNKTPRLELLVPAESDSGMGETITTYVFDFCVTEFTDYN